MIDLTKLKIGDKVDKKEFGELDMFEKNPRVVKISYQFYDDKSGIAFDMALTCKDYDEILGEDKKQVGEE